MGWLDALRRKEVTQENVGEYFATSVKSPQSSPFGKRPSMRDLASRYGMLVHRCVGINAQTAASIQPRLFAIGNAETLTKARGLNPKPLSTETKDYMQGAVLETPVDSTTHESCLLHRHLSRAPPVHLTLRSQTAWVVTYV